MWKVAGLVLSLSATPVWAQQVISANAGVIHYTEGDVRLDGKPVEQTPSKFQEMKRGQEIETGEGRAEILLTPGSILRLAENSSARMVNNRLDDTRIEVTGGAALFEIAELLKDNAVTVLFGEREIQLIKAGLYRVDANSRLLRVYEGEAVIAEGTQVTKVKKGRQADLGAVIATTKFEPKLNDAFLRWSSRRAGYIATANASAAKSIYDMGMPWGMSGWWWNPFFGMYTFIPRSGVLFSPFGYGFYSPIGFFNSYYRPVIVAASRDRFGMSEGSLGFDPGRGYSVSPSRGSVGVLSGGGGSGASYGGASAGGDGGSRGSGGMGGDRGSSNGGGRVR
jgi:hypothetical protein